jgi:SAM-dependent methyltransferase
MTGQGREQVAEANRSTFDDQRTQTELGAEGWCDPGERAALLRVAERARGGRILDVGVGTGRTTSLLRLLSDAYVGIDYAPAMVAAARSRHPGLDLRQDDARTLDSCADASFDLVLFSYNGIDAVDHDDRQRVLSSFGRVLRPGGLLVYSTLNVDGPVARERPWRLYPPTPWRAGTLEPDARSQPKQLLIALRDLVRHPSDRPTSLRNWRRLRPQAERGKDWELAPMGAHRFGLLVHLTGATGIRQELADHGFDLEVILGSDQGAPIGSAEPVPDWWFHVIARRRDDRDV